VPGDSGDVHRECNFSTSVRRVHTGNDPALAGYILSGFLSIALLAHNDGLRWYGECFI
jgi:hypothetical protein